VEIHRYCTHCFIRNSCRGFDMLELEAKRSADRLRGSDRLGHRADGRPEVVLCDAKREKRAADILIIDAGEEFSVGCESAMQRIPSVRTKVRTGDESYEQHKP
jgi:hypothetical protein